MSSMMVSFIKGKGASFAMTELQRPQTTTSGSRGNRSRYSLESPPPAAHISQSPSIVGKQYGWVKIINSEKRWNATWNRCYVLTECTSCHSIQWTLLGNLTRGLSKGCQNCSEKPKPIPMWLDRRLTAAKQRCENPNDQQFYHYGGRGIRFNFPSVIKAGIWIMENVPNVRRDYEMDRIDNNGNYEPGNIRFVSRSINSGNRRQTVLSEWDQEYWPYCRNVVTRMLSAGKTREEIIDSARQAVREKRKGWKTISAQLDFMTYEMPDRITVLPYRGISSTTAATAAASGH